MSMTPEERRAKQDLGIHLDLESQWQEIENYSKAQRKERLIQEGLRSSLRCRFYNMNGDSYRVWVSSKTKRMEKLASEIANLTPEEGQTLTELIHELSGYAMEVCEQIANPPVIEDPQPAQPTPQPDLF